MLVDFGFGIRPIYRYSQQSMLACESSVIPIEQTKCERKIEKDAYGMDYATCQRTHNNRQPSRHVNPCHFYASFSIPPFTDYICTSHAVCSMRECRQCASKNGPTHVWNVFFETGANSATWHRLCTLLKCILLEMTNGNAGCCYSIMTYHSIYCIEFYRLRPKIKWV